MSLSRTLDEIIAHRLLIQFGFSSLSKMGIEKAIDEEISKWNANHSKQDGLYEYLCEEFHEFKKENPSKSDWEAFCAGVLSERKRLVISHPNPERDVR